MGDLFDSTFGQVPGLKPGTYSFNPPDILGDIEIMGSNGIVGSVSPDVMGGADVEIGGEHVADIHDSVWGNYEIETDAGTFTSMDNANGGETLYHFGEPVAHSQPGVYGTDNWYDSQGDLIMQSGVDGLGTSSITIPNDFDMTAFDSIGSLDSFSSVSDFTDMADTFSDASDFMDLMDLF